MAKAMTAKTRSYDRHRNAASSVETLGLPPHLSKTILITGARAPVALHMTRLLADAGHVVHLVDSLNHPVSAASKACLSYHKLPSFRFDYVAAKSALCTLIDIAQIDVVIPTCEETFYLAQIWEEAAPAATLFAPSRALLTQTHNKHSFMDLCQSLKLEVPETHLLTTPQDVQALQAQAERLVFKPVWSRFAKNILIKPAAAKLTRIQPTTAFPWVAQAFVEGEELCAYAVAEKGKLRALATYRGLMHAGAVSICSEAVRDQAVEAFVTRFVQETHWTGQISFDFIRERSGRVLPLECNPRATSGLHFFQNGQAFSPAVWGRDVRVEPDAQAPVGVRLTMGIYGWPLLFNRQKRGDFLSAMRRTQNVFSWPGDEVSLWPQLRSLLEFTGLAIKRGISLEQATTYDLEWNGPDQG